MIWKEIFEALLDICRRPVSGPCVRKIEILEKDYRFDPALGLYSLPATEQRLVAQNSIFEQAGVYVRLLAETFKALEIHGTSVDICGHDHFQPITMGLERMIARLHVEWYSVEDRHDGASVVNLVLRASARSGCKIKRLITDIRSFSATLLRTEL